MLVNLLRNQSAFRAPHRHHAHHHISGDIVRKYLKDEVLANAVESHHGDIERGVVYAKRCVAKKVA